ncbi:MAG: hypothetical protein IT323_14940 [Anaerolineae bacterium]|nr:hypothetical protein [Anaerolineae bacterium]
MPVIMGEVEMRDLAQKLIKMRFARAKGYIRGLDKRRRLDFYRVSVADGEIQTRYTLPTLGLRITLVERRVITGAANYLGLRRTRFRYEEARVDPLPEHLREKPQQAAVMA